MKRQPREMPRPFLKWAGGKSALLDVLLRAAPETFNTYYEPFLGGGALFFGLYRAGRLQRAVLSDINPELVDTYQALRADVEAVIRVLESYPYSKDFYYSLREVDPWSLPLAERAARMIYLNKTCYNGLYRVNRAGKFNVPFGRYKNPNYRDVANLRAVAEALQCATLVCASFEDVVSQAQAGDFVYFDPPYAPLSQTARFTEYARGGFRREDQQRLAVVFRELAERGVWVMLSNSDTPFIRELYQDFVITRVHAPRYINSKPSRRGPQAEVLVTNYPVALEGPFAVRRG